MLKVIQSGAEGPDTTLDVPRDERGLHFMCFKRQHQPAV
jgi:hypothetical protein